MMKKDAGSDEVLEMKMPTVGEIPSPKLTLSEWMKADGDQVEMDEVIAEIESDKATFELSCRGGRFLARRWPKQALRWKSGALACKIETGGHGAGEQPAEEKDVSETKLPRQDRVFG